METRTVQSVGGGTVTVSLPKDWARRHGLTAGTEVALYTHADGSVVVRSAAADGAHLDAVELDIDGANPVRAAAVVRAAHAAGFESVTLRGDVTDDHRRTVRDAAGGLPGATVAGEGPEEVVVRTLLDAADVSVRQSLDRGRFLATSSLERAAEGLDGDAVDADALRERAAQADRLRALCERHARRSLVSFGEVDDLGVSRRGLADAAAATTALSRAARAGARLAAVSGVVDEPPAATAPLARDAASLVDDAATAALAGGDGAGDALAGVHAARDDVASLRERSVTGVALAGPLAVAVATGEDLARVALRARVREAGR